MNKDKYADLCLHFDRAEAKNFVVENADMIPTDILQQELADRDCIMLGQSEELYHLIIGERILTFSDMYLRQEYYDRRLKQKVDEGKLKVDWTVSYLNDTEE